MERGTGRAGSLGAGASGGSCPRSISASNSSRVRISGTAGMVPMTMGPSATGLATGGALSGGDGSEGGPPMTRPHAPH